MLKDVGPSRARAELFNAAHHPGMKGTLHLMIARDTMHQQQRLAVIEELGGMKITLPIPDSFPRIEEDEQHVYDFFDSGPPGPEAPVERRTSGPSITGPGAHSVYKNQLMRDALSRSASRRRRANRLGVIATRRRRPCRQKPVSPDPIRPCIGDLWLHADADHVRCTGG